MLYAKMQARDYEMTKFHGRKYDSYGFYHFQTIFHMFLGFFTVLLFFLNRSGRLVKPFEPYIFYQMAQFMLGMTILWTYLYFTQYLIMWYGRLPGDMLRYWGMMYHDLGPLW